MASLVGLMPFLGQFGEEMGMLAAQVRQFTQCMKSMAFNQAYPRLHISALEQVHDADVFVEKNPGIQSRRNDETAHPVELQFGSPHKIPNVGITREHKNLLVKLFIGEEEGVSIFGVERVFLAEQDFT